MGEGRGTIDWRERERERKREWERAISGSAQGERGKGRLVASNLL